MQRPVPCRVLHDQKRRPLVRHMIVAAMARPVSNGDFAEKLVAAEKRLAQLEQISLAPQFDVEQLADRTRPAVAADQIGRADGLNRTVKVLHSRGDSAFVLLE